jgi:hypothetical protein
VENFVDNLKNAAVSSAVFVFIIIFYGLKNNIFSCLKLCVLKSFENIEIDNCLILHYNSNGVEEVFF